MICENKSKSHPNNIIIEQPVEVIRFARVHPVYSCSTRGYAFLNGIDVSVL